MSSLSRIGIVSAVAVSVIGVTAGVYAFADPATPPAVSSEVRMSPQPALTGNAQFVVPPVAPIVCDDDDDWDDVNDPDDVDDLHDDLHDDLDDVNDPDDRDDLDDLHDDLDDCRR